MTEKSSKIFLTEMSEKNEIILPKKESFSIPFNEKNLSEKETIKNEINSNQVVALINFRHFLS